MSDMEPNDLNRRLRHLGRQLDDQRAAWNPAAARSTRSSRSWRRPALTAAVSAAVVAAALVTIAERNADAPATGSSPATSIDMIGATVPVEVPITVPSSAIETAGVSLATRLLRLPTAYPAVDDQIAGATAPQGGYAMTSYDNPTRVESLIARLDADATTMTDGLRISAIAGSRGQAAAELAPMAGAVAPFTATVWGSEADVYTEPGSPPLETVVIPAGDVTLRITGVHVLDSLAGTDRFVTVTSIPPVDDSGAPPFTLEFSDLPDGFALVVAPQHVPNGSLTGYLSFNNTATVEGNSAEVSTWNPLVAWASAHPMTAVEINGQPGWMSDRPGHAVIWQVNDETYVLVGGNATTDEAVAVANSLTFIDEATWRSRFNIPEPYFPPYTAASDGLAPIVTTPAPATDPTSTLTLPIGTVG